MLITYSPEANAGEIAPAALGFLVALYHGGLVGHKSDPSLPLSVARGR